MKRALYERIQEHMDTLPRFYSVNTPDLFATTSPETRQATKAHDYSVNWILDQGQPEIVNGSSGKTINDNTSRLSKTCCKINSSLFEIHLTAVLFSVFARFLEIYEKLLGSPMSTPVRYSEVKQQAVDYQAAKLQLNEALNSAGCGHWIEKPVEQDQFSL